MGTGVIDTVMAGHHGKVSLAAIGIGTSIYVTIVFGLFGIVQVVAPLAAEHYGAGRSAEVGEEVRQAFWLDLVLAGIAISLLLAPERLVAFTGARAEVAVEACRFLRAMAWTAPAALAFRTFSLFFTAVLRPRPVLLLNVAILLLKAPLNALLLYSPFGLPSLGVAGLGYASAISLWCGVAAAFAYVRIDPVLQPFRLTHDWSWPKARRIAALLQLGVPNGVVQVIEISSFTFMALFIARLGTVASAGHQIAANLTGIAFMLPLALSTATSVLVAQRLGAGERREAAGQAKAGLSLAAALATVVAVGYGVLSPVLATLYSGDAAVLAQATALIRAAAVFHWFDAMQVVLFGILRAYRSTLVPLFIYTLTLWGIGLGGGLRWAFSGVAGLPPAGAVGFWWAAIAGVAVCAAALRIWLGRVQARSNHS
jgi:MATE family multidrug resistance protein